MGNNKREMYKTGGGPAIITCLTPDEEILLSLIGPSTIGLEDRDRGDRELLKNVGSRFNLYLHTYVHILFY